MISASNANANVTRGYYNDNLLQYETEEILLSGGHSKTVTYTYNADGNRASTQYPVSGYTCSDYTYTNRNQLESVADGLDYVYDTRGNLTTRTVNSQRKHPEQLSVRHARSRDQIVHTLNGTIRTASYGYWDENNSNNRKWTRRQITVLPGHPRNKGEVFVYDLADQATGVQVDVPSPQNVESIPASIHYDGNGNRLWFGAYEWSDLYTTNNLNQYTVRTSLEGDNPQATPTPTPPRRRPRPASANTGASAGRARRQLRPQWQHEHRI